MQLPHRVWTLFIKMKQARKRTMAKLTIKLLTILQPKLMCSCSIKPLSKCLTTLTAYTQQDKLIKHGLICAESSDFLTKETEKQIFLRNAEKCWGYKTATTLAKHRSRKQQRICDLSLSRSCYKILSSGIRSYFDRYFTAEVSKDLDASILKAVGEKQFASDNRLYHRRTENEWLQ